MAYVNCDFNIITDIDWHVIKFIQSVIKILEIFVHFNIIMNKILTQDDKKLIFFRKSLLHHFVNHLLAICFSKITSHWYSFIEIYFYPMISIKKILFFLNLCMEKVYIISLSTRFLLKISCICVFMKTHIY